MGLTQWWLAAPDEEGWQTHALSEDELREFVAARMPRASLIAVVSDSDFGIVSGFGAYERWEVWINLRAARDHEPRAPQEQSRDMIDAATRWSHLSPTRAEPAVIAEVLEAHWVLAEEGVARLLSLFGLQLPYVTGPAASL